MLFIWCLAAIFNKLNCLDFFYHDLKIIIHIHFELFSIKSITFVLSLLTLAFCHSFKVLSLLVFSNYWTILIFLAAIKHKHLILILVFIIRFNNVGDCFCNENFQFTANIVFSLSNCRIIEILLLQNSVGVQQKWWKILWCTI